MIAEVKSDYDFMIKSLMNSKNKDKAKIDAKKQEKEQEVKKVKEEMEVKKKERISAINLKYDEKLAEMKNSAIAHGDHENDKSN